MGLKQVQELESQLADARAQLQEAQARAEGLRTYIKRLTGALKAARTAWIKSHTELQELKRQQPPPGAPRQAQELQLTAAVQQQQERVVKQLRMELAAEKARNAQLGQWELRLKEQQAELERGKAAIAAERRALLEQEDLSWGAQTDSDHGWWDSEDEEEEDDAWLRGDEKEGDDDDWFREDEKDDDEEIDWEGDGKTHRQRKEEGDGEVDRTEEAGGEEEAVEDEEGEEEVTEASGEVRLAPQLMAEGLTGPLTKKRRGT
ncbi:hypothetical protein HYH03_013490 [Edaphochlamys debaryana]|uniref:Uncharacterized protein n=1 Tax=Edaphochlamys debaryana TaxID=47281 RepID=A0A835XW47_9CHLO|nr:hypothetical protein HYH03_013490 [Edaphochlamys debaryana]|eukprot:KAG2487910.1 hypothetical protein HYH03_013490 [Edaphochlamys debaryana]